MNYTTLRQIARRCLPGCIQKCLSSLAGMKCCWEARYVLPKMRHYYASPAYDKVRAARLAELRRKERISVVFPIESMPKWKADSLLRLMKEHPRFAPSIRLKAAGDAAIKAYAASLGVPCLEFSSYETLPADCAADVVFVPSPYDGDVCLSASNRGIMKHNICYIPYGFFSIGNDWTMNQVANNAALFNLYENELSYRQAAAMMENKARNVRMVGHTMADAFLNPEARRTSVWKDCGKPMKKVIWAPHWTVSNTDNWFHSGNFLQLSDVMVQLAQKYAGEIQFAFKPHPGLYGTLSKPDFWGKEKTDAYYRLWAEMPNTQLETGTYAALFMQSDAMVHDSSSFIIEYMFADKPALFLRRGKGFEGYTPLAYEALKCYHIGVTGEEIDAFLQACVLGSDDPYAEVRREYRRRYLIPPHGVSAAQNVIDCLLGQGAYAEEPGEA